jgi:catechol 2,3-dioxygenase-like lactoylglutathione lyase family enzyme
MQSGLHHIQFNVRAEHLGFYRELFGLLGWRTLYQTDDMIGLGGKHDQSVWFAGQPKDVANDYDGPGMNHLGIGAESQADVDTLAAELRSRGVALLFETPRHRPEFSHDGQTYYQVMFESPDRILLEFVYTGPRQD